MCVFCYLTIPIFIILIRFDVKSETNCDTDRDMDRDMDRDIDTNSCHVFLLFLLQNLNKHNHIDSV